MRFFINFWDLNNAIYKYEYPMLIVDIIINEVVGNKMFSLWYNQIFIVKNDILKSAFWCLEAFRMYEWLVMPID